MAVISTECKEISLYLTEYQRGQLSKQEHRKVEEHLLNCLKCTKENEILVNLSIELDKIIPSVSKTYERDFVYNLFIRNRKENILIKIVSVSLILGLFFFILSGDLFSRKEYTSIKELKVRAENMFHEDFYSGKKTIE